MGPEDQPRMVIRSTVLAIGIRNMRIVGVASNQDIAAIQTQRVLGCPNGRFLKVRRPAEGRDRENNVDIGGA